MPAFAIFVASAGLLVLEVFDTRIFGVLFWRNSAVAVLSLALLGTGAAGLAIYLAPRWFGAERARRLTAWLLPGFGLSIPISYAASVRIAMATYDSHASFFRYGAVALAALVPFFVGGLVVSLVLSTAVERVSRLYFLDLLGGALGAAGALPLLSLCNGPLLVPVLGLVLGLVGGVYALLERSRLGLALSAACLAVAAVMPVSRAFDDVLRLHWGKGQERLVQIDRWGPESRVTAWHPQTDNQWLMIDLGVVTPVLPFDGDLKKVEYLKSNVLQLAYHVRPYRSVAVIGPGGGSDVLAAIAFGTPEIIAIEVNRAIVSMMTEEPLLSFSGGLYTRPDVSMNVADGRGFIAAMPRKVDLVQATFIDTRTAAAAGAHTLAEDYVYTVEAMHDYFDHLTDDGVISMSRWGFQPEGVHDAKFLETLRAVTTGYRTLAERGAAHPERHIVVVQGSRADHVAPGAGYQVEHGGMDAMATVLLKKSPFTPEEIERIRAVSARASYRLRWLPGIHEKEEPLASLMRSGASDTALADWYERRGLDLAPVRDDRPFFFSFVRPQDYFRFAPRALQNDVQRDTSYLGVRNLWQVLGATALLAFAILLAPLAVRLKNLRAHRGTPWILLYFSCLGLAFMGIEVGLMQRLSLFLGHPTYALVIVLAGTLLFSGLGSLSTERIREPTGRRVSKNALVLCLVLALYAAILPALTRFIALPFGLKVAIATAIIAPCALLMGRLFPLGIKAMGPSRVSLVPWVWGLNGGFSVVSSILALLIAMGWGYALCWWFFTGAYLVAGLSMAMVRLGD